MVSHTKSVSPGGVLLVCLPRLKVAWKVATLSLLPESLLFCEGSELSGPAFQTFVCADHLGLYLDSVNLGWGPESLHR